MNPSEYPLSETIAWGDESALTSRTPRMYLLGATVFAEDAKRDIAEFSKSKPPGMRKLHWHDMDDREKRRALSALAEVPHWSSVAIMAPMMPGARLERARRKCFERLLPNLEQRGVDLLVLESRWKQEDQYDIEMAAAMRSRKMIERIRLEHVRSNTGEPRLWAPDQIIGAIGEIMSTSRDRLPWGDAWNRLDARVTILMETIL